MVEHFSHGPPGVFLRLRDRSFQITGTGIPDQFLRLFVEGLEQLLLLICRRLDDVVGQTLIRSIIEELVVCFSMSPVLLYRPVEIGDPVHDDMNVDTSPGSYLYPVDVLTRDIYLLVLIPHVP